MKRIVLCLSLLVGCLSMYAAKSDVLRIVGNLRDAGDALVITQLENRRAVKTDTVTVNNGKLDVQLQMEKPMTRSRRLRRGALPLSASPKRRPSPR